MYFRFRLEFRRVFVTYWNILNRDFGIKNLKVHHLSMRKKGKVSVVLTKNDDRVIVLSDEPFYVTETVNEGLKNFVNNELKKGKIMSYCNFFQYLFDIVNECLVNWIPCQCITNC